MNPIPLIVVAGFLGAGKTTLLNHIISHAGGRRLAVLVNDFGDISIDAELISKHEGNTISLSNGCVCCTIGDSLVEALVSITRQAPRPEHIVIEASGVAEPHNIAEIARIDPDLRLNGIFVVADAEQIRRQADDKYVRDTVRHQLVAADVVLLSKIDRITDAKKRDVQSWMQRQIRAPRIIESHRGNIPISVILDADYSAESHAERGYQDHHDHDEQFEYWTFTSDRAFNPEALKELLSALPQGILRGKGFVRVSDEPDIMRILHIVGDRWGLEECVMGSPVGHTRLVFIAAKGSVSWKSMSDRLKRALTT